MVDAGEDLSNGSGVGNHAACTHHLGQVTTWYDCGRLVVDAALEACWAPVDKLNSALRLDCCHRSIHVLRHHVATIHHAAGHVLAVTWVALHKHCCWLENTHRDFSDGELLMIGLLRRDDRSVRAQHEVDTWVRYQIRLELSYVYIEGTIETQGCSQRGDDLTQQTVQIRVCRAFDVQVAAANVIKR